MLKAKELLHSAVGAVSAEVRRGAGCTRFELPARGAGAQLPSLLPPLITRQTRRRRSSHPLTRTLIWGTPTCPSRTGRPTATRRRPTSAASTGPGRRRTASTTTTTTPLAPWTACGWVGACCLLLRRPYKPCHARPACHRARPRHSGLPLSGGTQANPAPPSLLPPPSTPPQESAAHAVEGVKLRLHLGSGGGGTEPAEQRTGARRRPPAVGAVWAAMPPVPPSAASLTPPSSLPNLTPAGEPMHMAKVGVKALGPGCGMRSFERRPWRSGGS